MVTPPATILPTSLFIEEWMAARGQTDETLGLKMGKSRTTVWRWRTEQNRLNPEKIAAIAFALECQPEELWRPPGRPNLDAIVKHAPDDVVEKAADMLRILTRTEPADG